MREYEILSLRGVIEALRALPEGSSVRGISGDLHGDRGFYERSATDPMDYLTYATDLADEFERQIGNYIPGWKGGDYFVSADRPVAVAEEGRTGPYIAGFEPEEPGSDVYEVVGAGSAWF